MKNLKQRKQIETMLKCYNTIMCWAWPHPLLPTVITHASSISNEDFTVNSWIIVLITKEKWWILGKWLSISFEFTNRKLFNDRKCVCGHNLFRWSSNAWLIRF